MIPYKMIYTINMHTTVYQFWRFVYHYEQSVIDHYARISFCTKIRLHVYHLSWPKIKIPVYKKCYFLNCFTQAWMCPSNTPFLLTLFFKFRRITAGFANWFTNLPKNCRFWFFAVVSLFFKNWNTIQKLSRDQ